MKTINRKLSVRNVIVAIYVGSGALLATRVLALPTDDTNMSVVNGGAAYSYDGGAAEGTLIFQQNNSIVSFAVDPVKIVQGETLNVMPGVGGSASWVGVIRDDSGMPSELNGTLAPSMRVLFLNSNGLLTGGDFTVDFSSLANASGALVLSSHSLDANQFAQGSYQLDSAAAPASIRIQGLQVQGQGAKILVLSDQLTIEGTVNVPAGDFHGITAGKVDVMFGVSDMIAIQSALPVSQVPAGITTTGTANISAANVDLQAWVSDPLSLALNNRGMVTATGISVNERGKITLVGRGGNLVNTGLLDAADPTNGDGQVRLEGNIVALGGTVEAGQGQISVAIGNDQTGDNGEFRLLGNTSVQAGSAEVNGLGLVNTVSGLANYRVMQANAGTAGWLGVGGNDWSNTGTGEVTFNGVSRLIGRVDIRNDMLIDTAGSLTNTSGTALLRGGARSDTFTIAGTAQRVDGLGGDDLFVMQGGRVEDLIDGGGGIDTIQNVFTVSRFGPQGINGTSDFVNWVNIQNVLELPVPTPVPLPDLSGVIAPQTSFANVSNITAASLGLVGAGAEPRLPCGFGSAPIVNETDGAALLEEPCMEDFSGPEFQQLISSLIHFDNDSVAITAASAERLNKVAGFFVDSNVFGKVVIAAHTDDNGSEVYNLALSSRRADSTSRYMQSKGVGSEYIESFYFGEVLPAKPNSSAENRAHNRRAHIELKR